MRFMLLLHGDEKAEAEMSEDDARAIIDAHMAFGQSMRDDGQAVFGAALASSESATVVRRDVVTDGPFVEAREQIGGVYVVECAHLDEAIGLARRVPESPGLVVEIRPIMDV